MRRLVICLLAALAVCTALWAARQVEFACKSTPCKFRQEVIFGNEGGTGRVTGWCAKCQKFVWLTWELDSRWKDGVPPRDPPPKTVGKAKNPATGKVEDRYACPECRSPFFVIAGPDDVKKCPKCGKAGFGYDPKKVVTFD